MILNHKSMNLNLSWQEIATARKIL